MTTGTAIFRYNDQGDWVFTDRNGNDHYPGTIAFGCAAINLYDRVEEGETTDEDEIALMLWPTIEIEED